jgi:hypothetical protein
MQDLVKHDAEAKMDGVNLLPTSVVIKSSCVTKLIAVDLDLRNLC